MINCNVLECWFQEQRQYNLTLHTQYYTKTESTKGCFLFTEIKITATKRIITMENRTPKEKNTGKRALATKKHYYTTKHPLIMRRNTTTKSIMHVWKLTLKLYNTLMHNHKSKAQHKASQITPIINSFSFLLNKAKQFSPTNAGVWYFTILCRLYNLGSAIGGVLTFSCKLHHATLKPTSPNTYIYIYI